MASDAFRKRNAEIDAYAESLILWQARIKAHPHAEVFGRPICSECERPMMHHQVKAPHDHSARIHVWSCNSGQCYCNREVRIKPCSNCGVREGRMLIDTRFNRLFKDPRVLGHWAACRLCGAYGDPGGHTIIPGHDPGMMVHKLLGIDYMDF